MLFQTALMKERLGNSSVITTLDLSGNPCTSSFTVLETLMTGIMENPPDRKGFIKELGISVPCYRREDIEVIFAETTFMKVCIQKSKFLLVLGLLIYIWNFLYSLTVYHDLSQDKIPKQKFIYIFSLFWLYTIIW